MAPVLYVVTHPEVDVQPDVPVPDWGLSAAGRRRVRGLLGLSWVGQLRSIFCSGERKARQTAELVAAARDHLPLVVVPELGENDRSATGFLPPEEFEELADRFFAQPTVSARGWETAERAQQRIVSAVDRCLEQAPPGDLAVFCHGAVGTLLWCHLAGRPIDRRHDQPGQGSWYPVDVATREPLTGWQRLPTG